MSAQEDFQLEQYKQLRIEINNNIAEIRTLQRYAVAGVVIVWAWIASNASVAPGWAAFAPLAFVLVGVVHSQRVLGEMRDMGVFIAITMETSLCEVRNGHSTGWETWIRNTPPKTRTLAKALLPQARREQEKSYHNPMAIRAPVWVEWIIVTALILLVGFWQVRHPKAPEAPVSKCVACAK